MAKTVTTSIRLDPDIRNQLEYASQILHRGKNWIILQALQEYLTKIKATDLAVEARRQSLLASKQDLEAEDIDELWEQNQDTSGWI